MRRGMHAVGGAIVAVLVLAAPSALAANGAGGARLSSRGRAVLAHSGYTHIHLVCNRRSCRWSAARRTRSCSGTLASGRGRRIRVTRVWCTAPHKTAPHPAQPHAESTPPTPAGGSAPAPAPSVTHAVLFGFNTYITPGTIAMERALGATVTRMIVPWSTVEAMPGQWNWQQSDQEYAELLAAGLAPEIVAVAAPCWARPSMTCDDARYTGPPDRAYDGDWSDFVARLAARYPQALGIEVWNEPNLDMFFWPAPDPARYTELLAEAYRAVKGIDQSMPVISGGIAASPATGVVPLGEGDKPFLAAMYADGAAGSMDAIAAHPYPIAFSADGSQVWDPAAMEQSLGRLRAARDAAGDRSRPIWITEVGESTSSQDGFPPAVSAARQAADLSSMIRAASSDSDVPVMIVHSLQDQAAGTDDALNGVNSGFGVFDAAGAPKPAGCMLSGVLHGSLSC